MTSLFRHIKAAWSYATHFPWVDEASWGPADSKAMEVFLTSPAGLRFKALCVNAVLRQQANALSKTNPNELLREAGYTDGQKGLVAFIESLADTTKFTEQGDQDTDSATTQPES